MAAMTATGMASGQVRPSVSFRPVDKLFTVVYQARRSHLHIGIKALFDKNFCITACNIGNTDIDAVQVAACA